MTLDSQPKYPSTRSYVVKLRRDASSAADSISGRLENLVTGHHREFDSGEQLLALLATDLKAQFS